VKLRQNETILTAQRRGEKLHHYLVCGNIDEKHLQEQFEI